jgi:phosphatidylinositol alpha-1,6-mannosyltransferase
VKILSITDSHLPHAGASRVYNHNVYKRLASGGAGVAVLNTKVSGWELFDASLASERLRVVRRGTPLQYWKFYRVHEFLLSLFRTLRVILSFQPDIVHAGDLYPQGLVAWLLKKTCRIPYVAYCHGEGVTQMDSRRLERRMRDMIYRGADAVIACSNFARGNLIRIGGDQKRIVRINPGVDSTRFHPGVARPDLVQRFSLGDKQVLLTVARLIPRKGHGTVLAGLARMASTHKLLRYLIVGMGPEEVRLRVLVGSLHLEDSVIFAGFVADAELADSYRLCDVLVMPNSDDGAGDIEGFGMLFLDASATGKAVIGGCSGGTAEAVEDGVTGFLVNPDSVDALNDRLRSLLDEPALREGLGRHGLARARQQFSWDTRAALVQQLSKQVAGILPHAEQTTLAEGRDEMREARS